MSRWNASAATAGTCPLPVARVRSTRWATPSSSRASPDSGADQVDRAGPRCPAGVRSSLFLVFGESERSRAGVSRGSPICSSMGRTRCPALSVWASIQSRSRRCGAPTWRAPSTHHSASYPRAARSPRTRPSPREASAGTFSTKTNRGRISRTTRANSDQSPDLGPVIPAPVPAVLMSWHGKPPETQSTTPRYGRPSNSRTSP